jgi:hypothetical protein
MVLQETINGAILNTDDALEKMAATSPNVLPQ